MGCGTSTSESTQSFDSSSQLKVDPRSTEEQALLDQFINLGTSQTDALNQIRQEALTGDPFALSDQAKAGINQYYDTGLDRMRLEGKDYADFLSGSRGLRMSDTPIAQQALQRYGLGLADLEGQRARDLVNYGFAGNQYRTNLGLMASQALPSGSVAAFNPLFSERMATGTQRQWGTGKTSGSQTMSPLQQVLMGTQAFNQFNQGLAHGSSAGMNFAAMGMSDLRLKRDIKPVSWKWKDGDEKTYFGVIAQEVATHHPHLVRRDEHGMMMVDYGTITAMLLAEREHLYRQLEHTSVGA